MTDNDRNNPNVKVIEYYGWYKKGNKYPQIIVTRANGFKLGIKETGKVYKTNTEAMKDVEVLNCK